MLFNLRIVNYELIIVRYGEIALKGKETRKHFESILVRNIKFALGKNYIINRTEREWGRIYVYTDQVEKSLLVLKKIFGVTSVSPAIQTSSDIKSISKLAVEVSRGELRGGKTFAIRATRTGKHDFTSQDVAVQIGSDIVKATKAIVNLTKPDFELFIEIRNDKAFVFTEKIRGMGGMPVGSQGRILALVDSPYSVLAAWYLIRRGCNVTFIITKESLRDILCSFADNWYIESDVYKVESGKTIFETLNKIASEKKCDAMVTSHNILNNSKKTLSDIKMFKKHVNFPVLHPLIAMDIQEIDNKCKEIGIPI